MSLALLHRSPGVIILKALALATASAALLMSCATIVRGTSQEVLVTSDPPGAAFMIGIHKGNTPATITLRRADVSLPAQFELDGYKQAAGVVVGDSKDPEWIVPAIIEGLLIWPAIVDLASGAFNSFPNEVHATMQRSGKPGFSTVQAQK